MKRLIVRWFFRFSVQRTQKGEYRILVRAPFGVWEVISWERFVTRTSAERAMEEIRKDGAFLFDAIQL